METLTFLGLSLVLTGGALWIIGCLVNLCNAGQEKTNSVHGLITYHNKILKAKNKLNGEAREWQKETKITLAPSHRLCEEAVKHLN